MKKETVRKINGRIRGDIKVPGDKSISHRSIIFGSIANGLTEISNFLNGEDCLWTTRAFQQLGVNIEVNDDQVKIQGKGFNALQATEQEIFLGNSGTGMRLLSGLFSGLPFSTTLTGDESLSKRPMARVIDPLSEMGAVINSSENKAPLIINPESKNPELKAIQYDSPIASAQVKSSILLAGLSASGRTSVSEPHKSRDHTEIMMKSFGANVVTIGNKTKIDGVASRDQLQGQKIQVPSDISSAAFFLVAGAILEDSQIKLIDVGINPTRTGILDVFDAMFVDHDILNEREINGEKIADILVRSSAMQGTTIGGDLIPRLIDEIPVIAVLAAQAQGTTTIKDAAELKVKESNRIATTLTLLKALGVQAEETADGMIIEGRATKPFEPKEELTSFDCHGDHRLAMAAAIAAIHSSKPIKILQTEFVNTSFPGFFQLLNDLGIKNRVPV